VRDRIPEIIEENEEETAVWKQVSDSRAEQLLREKLVEESQEEFVEEDELAELADLYAVMKEYMDRKNISISDLEKIESEKRKKRGGFKDNILLERIEET